MSSHARDKEPLSPAAPHQYAANAAAKQVSGSEPQSSFVTHDAAFLDVLGDAPRLMKVADVDAHEGPVDVAGGGRRGGLGRRAWRSVEREVDVRLRVTSAPDARR